jgi:hypothetical protein
LQRRQENIVVGQVLGAESNNEDGDEEEARSVGSNNEDLTFSCALLCDSKKRVTIAVVLVLAVIAIIVGSVIATTSSNSQKGEVPPMAAPTSSLPGLTGLLSSVSFDNGTALQTPSTPQNAALLWLSNNENLNIHIQTKQRFNDIFWLFCTIVQMELIGRTIAGG